LPSLVLLDLQLPKLSGLEVLQWIRKHPDFRTLIVVILAGLPLDGEIQRAYLFGANSLLIKGASEEQLHKKVRLIKDYWMEANQAA
jgi:CheY-like chemotaxis protein